MSQPGLRRLVHASMLGFVFLLPLLGGTGMALFAAAATVLNFAVLPRTALGRAMAREGEGNMGGLVTYPLAVLLLFLFFQPAAAAGAWAILALGDAAAAAAGTAVPRSPRIPWNKTKSVAGSVAFLLAATAGAMLVVSLVGNGTVAEDLQGDGAERAQAAAREASSLWKAWPAAAAVGALVESLPLRIDDNLPIALMAAITATVLLV